MAVVVWHSRPPQSLRIFTMFFAVPLFFFTSGYFYKPSKTIKELRTFYIKRIKGLYIPYVKWSLVFLVLHNVCFHLNLYNGQYGFRGATSELYTWTDFAKKAFNIIFRLTDNEQLLGAFWFLGLCTAAHNPILILNLNLTDKQPFLALYHRASIEGDSLVVNDKNVPKPFKVFLEGYITTQNHLKQQIYKNTIPCVFR